MTTRTPALLVAFALASLALCACDLQSDVEARDARGELAIVEAPVATAYAQVAASEERLVPISLVGVRAIDESRDVYELTMLADNRGGSTLPELALSFAPEGDDPDASGAVVYVDDEIAADAFTELTVVAEGLELSDAASLTTDESPVASNAEPDDTLVAELPPPLAKMVWHCIRTGEGWQCRCILNCVF